MGSWKFQKLLKTRLFEFNFLQKSRFWDRFACRDFLGSDWPQDQYLWGTDKSRICREHTITIKFSSNFTGDSELGWLLRGVLNYTHIDTSIVIDWPLGMTVLFSQEQVREGSGIQRWGNECFSPGRGSKGFVLYCGNSTTQTIQRQYSFQRSITTVTFFPVLLLPAI